MESQPKANTPELNFNVKMKIFLQINLSPNMSDLFYAKCDLLLAFMAKNNGHQNLI